MRRIYPCPFCSPTPVRSTASLQARSVGLASGTYFKQKNRIIDSQTSEEIGRIVTINYMAEHTRWQQDIDVHQFIYPHLCSYSHTDIMALMQYIEGDRFTTRSPHRIHQAGLYSFFFFT